MRSAIQVLLRFLLLAVFVFSIHSPVLADWDPGGPHKMHFPQLPDPLGWDVVVSPRPDGTRNIVADDWQCTESGPVSAVHFWYSWRDDFAVPIESVHLSIHRDIPDPDPDNPQDFSMPGELLWERDFFLKDDQFSFRQYGQGDQGWFDPAAGVVLPGNHQQIWQLNIVDIRDPFRQTEGEIYWLDVSVNLDMPAGEQAALGWKTSLEHWNDDAVYLIEQLPAGEFVWGELFDPLLDPPVSLDMAFVIVPEPGSCIVLGIGMLGLFVVLRRTRQ